MFGPPEGSRQISGGSMRKISTALFFACCLTALIAQGPKPPETTASGVPAPPKTSVNEVKETIHGVEIVDSYRWLEDQNSPETRSWIDAENAYTDALLSHIAGRETLQAKVAALLKVEFMGMPVVRNNRYFFL